MLCKSVPNRERIRKRRKREACAHLAGAQLTGAAGDGSDLARRGEPDRQRRERATADRHPEGERIAAGHIVRGPRQPTARLRPRGSPPASPSRRCCRSAGPRKSRPVSRPSPRSGCSRAFLGRPPSHRATRGSERRAAASSATQLNTKPPLPIVHTHSRPIRSDKWPSAIWPGTATRLTKPNAQAGLLGSKPISIRYFVWWTCTAYQVKRPQK